VRAGGGLVGLVAGARDDLSEALARAEALRGQGWRVRVLSLRPVPRGVVGVEALPVADLPDPYRVPHAHGDGPCERSDRVRLALERLHAREPFARIEFPALGAAGFRAVQAKRAGLAFADTQLAVRLDGAGAWERRRAGRWPDELSELEGDFAERYAFENACVQVAPDPQALERAREGGWAVRPPVPAGMNPAARPLVTVCVPHFNLGRHLPSALESLAAQTYPHLDVVAIDDGSTDDFSRSVFSEMEARHPRFRFLRQANAGIGATRNRGLAEARGELFLPFDADNVARADMVERLVTAIRGRPDVAALTCYFLAFAADEDLARGRFLYAYRPTGGPHVLACLRNVYGDATAVYRTEAFRSVGGYETDRGTSFEDWEAFVKLANAGHAIDVVPEHLFYYRHLQTGFSRVTNPFANHERVLRQFRRLERLPPGEGELLWDALAGLYRRLERLEARQRSRRYRLADRLHAAWKTITPGRSAP
jgi:glycosyltransferase involved in cell wall biosynthesis